MGYVSTDPQQEDRWKKHRKPGSKQNLTVIGKRHGTRSAYWTKNRERVLEERKRARERRLKDEEATRENEH